MQNSERHNDYTISTRRPKKAENAFSAGVQHEASSEGSRPTTPTSDQESHGAAKRQIKTKNKSGQDVPKKAERTVSERTQRRYDLLRASRSTHSSFQHVIIIFAGAISIERMQGSLESERGKNKNSFRHRMINFREKMLG